MATADSEKGFNPTPEELAAMGTVWLTLRWLTAICTSTHIDLSLMGEAEEPSYPRACRKTLLQWENSLHIAVRCNAQLGKSARGASFDIRKLAMCPIKEF